MESIEKILNFIVEIEKLKGIQRKTRPVGLDRYENSAEHSWHICLCALMLKEYANEKIDIDRVIKMLLIHDLGEIDAGDTIVYSSQTKAVKAKEREGVKRVLSFLPEEQSQQYLLLWDEFEAGETSDSKYAKAIDRIPPLLHNIHGKGHSWAENNITLDKVLTLNSAHITQGSDPIWNSLETKIKEVFANEPMLKENE